MGLKENLLKKRKIEILAKKVLSSLKPTDYGVKVDRQAMRKLLTWSRYQRRDERDLELWTRPGDDNSGRLQIIVLDGELKCYHTTVEDVVMRKSPTVKEMISIKNAIKILNDKDVVVSRKADTVLALKTELIAQLDLTVSAEGVGQIADGGREAFDNRYPDGVVEALELLADLLAWKPAPSSITPAHCRIWGRAGQADHFGPLVLYAMAKGRLALEEKDLPLKDPETAALIEELANGKATAAAEDRQVWPRLCELVLERHGTGT